MEGAIYSNGYTVSAGVPNAYAPRSSETVSPVHAAAPALRRLMTYVMVSPATYVYRTAVFCADNASKISPTATLELTTEPLYDNVA